MLSMNKQDQILNRLATNFGVKVGQLEGEKAVLQIELELVSKENEELRKEIEELKKEEEEPSDVEDY